ncbi:mandelate racemase/muconate lactonizing enzyme family protein (plasmid) [Phyllobacteriaceae bacterium JZ32]
MTEAAVSRLRDVPPRALRIGEVSAWAVSCPLPPEAQVTLGVGRAIKRDAVVVRIRTEDGLVGWGEAHHGRAHTAVAAMINDCFAPLLKGSDAADVVGLWARMARSQMLTQGTGAAAALAISGIDIALWDIRAQAVGWPLCRLLGGAPRPIPAYAGGVALGWDGPEAIAEEAMGLVKSGFRAVKLRIGDTLDRDFARLRAVRTAIGDDIVLLADANSLYSDWDARRAMPVLAELGVRWLEEPFRPQERRAYLDAARYAALPLAAGENLFTRQEFTALILDGAVTIIQPDLSKVGGITEALRISALALGFGLEVHPHASMTGLNTAATLHFLSAVEGGGYLEADVSRVNPLRDALVSAGPEIRGGMAIASEASGLGVAVDEAFLKAHPPIPGSGYRRVEEA